MAAAQSRPSIDWERIEHQYRAGVMSLREIGAQHGVAAATILKRAKKGGWERDLAPRIKAKAEAAVNKAAVNRPVNSQQTVSEREVIDANAHAIADIRLGHRSDIRDGRALVASLLAELRGLTDRPELVDELVGAVAPTDDDQAAERQRKLRDAVERVTSITGRVQAIGRLSEALKNLVALERQAWGLDEIADADASGRKVLSDIERASRLAALLDRARRAKEVGGDAAA